MKKLSVVFAVLALSLASFAQSNPVNIYAAGASFNQSASPQVAGTALYAHLLSDGSGTYGFSVYDALPQSTSPFTVTSNIGAGISQKLFTVGSVNFYAPTAAGISFSGSNTGWQWNTGLLASIHLKNNWRLMPNVRVIKSSVSGGSGYQPVIGFLVGWGQ
jgi:hypothetical protein